MNGNHVNQIYFKKTIEPLKAMHPSFINYVITIKARYYGIDLHKKIMKNKPN